MHHCQLCYCPISTLPTSNKISFYSSKILEIKTSVYKYLSRDVIQTINWNVAFNVNPFCDECVDNTLHLLQLDIKLEQVNSEIKQLLNRINEKISIERQNYHLGNSGEIIQQQDHNFPVKTSEIRKPDNIPLQLDTHVSPFAVCDATVGNTNIYDSFEESYHSGEPDVHESVTHLQKQVSAQDFLQNQPQNNVPAISRTVTSSELQLQSGSSGFPCQNCNKKFTRLDILKRHQCKSQTYECITCGKSFSSHGSLQLHKRIHDGEKPHKCETCGKCFSLPHHLRLHIRTHTGEKPYECEICKKSFSDKSYLTKHKVQHSSDESERRKYSCEICSKRFTLYNSLKNHLVRHTGDTRHNCQTCGKGFATKAKLRKHEIIHSDERNFKCTHCWKTFRSEQCLKEHSYQHTDEKPFQCDKCGSSFYTVARLNMHVNLKHSDHGDFICDVCGKLFKTQLQLNQHRRRHIQKPKPEAKSFKCIVCERRYSDEKDMIRHQKVAHVVTTITSFHCEHCGSEFENYSEYHNHNRTRMGKASSFHFKCGVCNEVVRSRCDMISHFKEKHTEAELPYKCFWCGSAYIGRNDLFRHRQTCEAKPEMQPKKSKKSGNSKSKKNMEISNESDNGKNISTRTRKSKLKTSKGPVRKSERVRKRKMKSDTEDSEFSDFSTYEESESDVGSPENVCNSENDNDISFQLKAENEEWIKEEPEDFPY